MSISLTVNGVTYPYPQPSDLNWGTGATNWAQAVTNAALFLSAGSFPITAQLDFGSNFGLKALNLITETANPASAGYLRLANTDVIGWRNNANGADLPLGVNSSDQLTYNGNPITGSTALTASRAVVTGASGLLAVATTTSTEIGYVAGVTSAIQTQINTKITAGAGAIVDADVSASAAIARSKLASGTINQVVINNGSGVLTSEAALAKVRGGTGADNSSVTFPSTGTVQATTPSNHGVIVSGSAAIATVIAPDASTSKVLTSGGASADPTWALVSLTAGVTGTLPATNGGTGLAAFTTGDILYASATNTLSALPKGTSGQFLKIGASIPTWATVTATNPVVQSKTSNYTILSTDDVVLGDSSGGTFTLTLPAASSAHFLTIKKTDSSTTAITISRAGSDTIDDASTGLTSTTVNSQGEWINLVSDGAATWQVTGRRSSFPVVNLSWTFAGVTASSSKVASMRMGAMMKVTGQFVISNAAASTFSIGLPSGIAIDSSVMSSTANGQFVGMMGAATNPVTQLGSQNSGGVLFYDGSDTANLYYATTSNSAPNMVKKTGTSIFDASTTEMGSFYFTIPVSGWK